MQFFTILLAILAVFSMTVDADAGSTAKPRRRLTGYAGGEYADRGVHWGPEVTRPRNLVGKYNPYG